MKKFDRKDYRNIGILFSIVFIFLTVLLCFGYIFGSKVDWANQHIVFPEIFRMLFYKTHSLLPSFFLNLGNTQNIYYFSYYGLLSPIVILSYFLPFVKMSIFMPIISIVSLLSSVTLFYRWINDKYDSKIALIASLLFLLNSTFFYHFHRHIMFVIYMPFLIWSLINVDNYLKNKKILPLVISTFLIIMTNYYFGAYSCIVIFIYTIYSLLNNKFNYLKATKVVWFEVIAIMMSAILLIPTIYALITGRIETLTSSINIFKLLSPVYNFKYTFYNTYYSWGLTFIYVLSIIFGFISKKRNRTFLSIIMSLIIIFPIFSFILNGGMYVDGKCYLPFLPLAILNVCDFISDVVSEKVVFNKYLKYVIVISICLVLCTITKIIVIFALIDTILTIIVFSNSDKIKNKYLLFIPAILISLSTLVCSSFNDEYMDIKTYKKINNSKYSELSKYINDDELYRLSVEDNKRFTINKIYNSNNLRTSVYSSLSNKNYYNQTRNVLQNEILNRDNFVLNQSSSVLFNIYSGTRYLISSSTVPIGYKDINTIDNTTLYENVDVLPLAYTSNRIMSKREFDSLSYPYQLDALLNYIVVDKDIENVYEGNIEKVDLDYRISNIENVEYKIINNHYIIDAQKNAFMKIKINPIDNKILIIRFKMNEAKKGFACSSDISINGINNSLSCDTWKYNNNNNTFEYVLSSNDVLDTLEIKLSSDTFDISDIETYTMDYNVIKELNNNINKIDFKLSNNKLVSNVYFSNDSYVKTTIPYEEKGYKLLIDGKENEIIKVDDTYIGFIIPQGSHNIELIYEIPYLKEGIIISLLGILSLIVTLILSRIKIFDIYKKYEEIINYIIIGGLTTVVSLTVYYGLTFTIMDPNNAIELQITNVISWIVSVTFAYFTNRKIVFKKKEKANLKEASEFFASRITTLLLDILLMYVFVTLLHFNDKIIKLIVQVIIIVLNYILSKFLVFNKKKK